MTTPTYVPPDPSVVSGTGPYPFNAPYLAATDLSLVVVLDGVRTVLADDTWSIAPEASETGGNITLTLTAATAYADGLLYILRDTDLQQGWQGIAGTREKGLETQLDRLTRAGQDQHGRMANTLRLDRPLDPLTPVPNTVLTFDADGNLVLDPSTYANLQAAEAAQEAAETAAATAQRVFPTWTAALNDPHLTVGQIVSIARGTLGQPEEAEVVAAATYDLTGYTGTRIGANTVSNVQLVSLCTDFADEDDLMKDRRQLAAGTYLRIASLDISHGADARTFVVAPAGVTDYDLVTAGGTLLYAQFGFPAASGVRAPMTHVVVIGDSIVEGSDGTDYGYGPVWSWTTEWIKKARATLGDSGGYTAFDLTKANHVGVGYEAKGTGSGGVYTPLINLPSTDPQRQRSLDFNGVYFANWDTTSNVTWNPHRNWDTFRIFFLRQSGGGKFEADHYGASGTYRIQIDTSKQATSIGGGDSGTAMAAGTYQLDYIDLPKAVGGSVNIRVRGTGAGLMCLYGPFLIEDNGQCAYTMVCKGGYRARDYATLLDDATQKLWYQYLAPSHTVYCLGTNDRVDTDAATFMGYLSTTVGRVLTGSTAAGTASEIVLVAPNKTSAEGNMPGYRTAMAALARSRGWGYANNADYLGEYRDAKVRGLMMVDGTHPSDLGRTLIAHNLCKYFGLPSALYAFPAAYDSGSGSATIELAQTLSNIRTGSVITAGTPQLLYNLGLVGGNPNVMIDVTVTGQRELSGFTVTQTQTYRLSNGTTTNQVTQFAAVGSVSGPGAEASAGGLTWGASIVGGLLQISVTPTGYNQRLMASARVYNANNTVVGNPVIEN